MRMLNGKCDLNEKMVARNGAEISDNVEMGGLTLKFCFVFFAFLLHGVRILSSIMMMVRGRSFRAPRRGSDGWHWDGKGLYWKFCL